MNITNFRFAKGILNAVAVPGQAQNNLHSLAHLAGNWKGSGINQIWRPLSFPVPGQDRFLELNNTSETLEVAIIPGGIPNRGLLQGDINLFGLRYLQQVSDAITGSGLHIEPGLWVSVPSTVNPGEPATVVRMGSIPHGTTIQAQGPDGGAGIPGKPPIAPVSITPFVIGNPGQQIHFPEANLSVPTPFRTPPAQMAGITQAMVNDPNSVLRNVINNQNVTQFVPLQITTNVHVQPPVVPNAGGGTDNIPFLSGAPTSAPAGAPNANAVQMTAVFWIETVQNPNGSKFLQLQYTQTVLLNFNGLSWPHVSVGTLLLQQSSKAVQVQSALFPHVFLRQDGSGVNASHPVGGVVNCQFNAGPWEHLALVQFPDGTYSVQSNNSVFPNTYLNLVAGTVGPAHPAPGGTVNLVFAAPGQQPAPTARFNLEPLVDGSFALNSVASPGVYLRMDGSQVHQPNGSGAGIVNCQFGLGPMTSFLLINS